MKLVINRCYGGFSLSPRAVKRMAELNGKQCYFFKRRGLSDDLTQITLAEASKGMFWSAYTVKNPVAVAGPQDNWHGMTDAQKQESNARWDAISLDRSPSNRADPILVKVVEELGSAADGDCAELAVVAIPDGVEYTIEEYDGLEHVAEAHRTWS